MDPHFGSRDRHLEVEGSASRSTEPFVDSPGRRDGARGIALIDVAFFNALNCCCPLNFEILDRENVKLFRVIKVIGSIFCCLGADDYNLIINTRVDQTAGPEEACCRLQKARGEDGNEKACNEGEVSR